MVVIPFGLFFLLALVYSLSLAKKNGDKVGTELAEVLNDLKSKGIKPVQRGNVPLRGKAAWIYGSTLREKGSSYIVEEFRKLGMTHIFVLLKGTSGTVIKDTIIDLTPKAHEKGMYVHAWTACFADSGWTKDKPSPESYEYRKYLLQVISDFLTTNASGHYIDGIHLDYIRYGSSAQDKWGLVSSFVKEVKELVTAVSPGAVLSIASKAENYISKIALSNSALFYGQNYTDLAKYVDLFCPMTYYLDYGIAPEDVGMANRWVKELTNKPVFAGIQLHPSEASATQGKDPSVREIERNLNSCSENGIDGVIFYRFEFIIQNSDIESTILEHHSF